MGYILTTEVLSVKHLIETDKSIPWSSSCEFLDEACYHSTVSWTRLKGAIEGYGGIMRIKRSECALRDGASPDFPFWQERLHREDPDKSSRSAPP